METTVSVFNNFNTISQTIGVYTKYSVVFLTKLLTFTQLFTDLAQRISLNRRTNPTCMLFVSEKANT